jgi:hypothetical protein
VAVLHLEHLTKEALRAAFAILGQRPRCRLGAGDPFVVVAVLDFLVEGNPMAAVRKPRRVDGAPRAIRDPNAAARLS